MSYRTLNPATGELVAEYREASPAEIEAAISGAERAWRDWRRRPIGERTALVARMGAALESQAGDLARLMALEMGKPLAEGEAEANKCAWVCRYYAENAEAFLAPEARPSDGSEAWLRFDPLGPILAIMPWNFPLWQFYRFAAPALSAGNVVLLKHARGTPACALRIEAIARECGFPEGAVRNLFLTRDQATAVIGDPRVRGVTLTGSTRAGREVAAAAGTHLKPMVLELGGSDPFIVFDDADLDETVGTAVKARCLNGGQSCIAAKRFLVQRGVFEAFRDRFVAGMRARVMGDPSDRSVDLGPLARQDLRETLAAQVDESRASGAEALCGGEVPGGPGFFYPPTVLAGGGAAEFAAREEFFGPVATLIPFDGEDEAVQIANAAPYGLGASLWTGDRARAGRLVPEIESGAVFVNGLVKSDPRLPFGGVKDSGFGRELGREGILEFVNAKTVWIR